MSDNDKRDLLETLQSVKELYEDNEDTIRDIIGADSPDVSKVDPLTEVHWEDEQVVVLFNDVDVSKGVSMRESEQGVEFDVGDDTVDIEMPEDIEFGDHDIVVNNGVLTATFNRSD